LAIFFIKTIESNSTDSDLEKKFFINSSLLSTEKKFTSYLKKNLLPQKVSFYIYYYFI
jgi:hypothetical protein